MPNLLEENTIVHTQFLVVMCKYYTNSDLEVWLYWHCCTKVQNRYTKTYSHFKYGKLTQNRIRDPINGKLSTCDNIGFSLPQLHRAISIQEIKRDETKMKINLLKFSSRQLYHHQCVSICLALLQKQEVKFGSFSPLKYEHVLLKFKGVQKYFRGVKSPVVQIWFRGVHNSPEAQKYNFWNVYKLNFIVLL